LANLDGLTAERSYWCNLSKIKVIHFADFHLGVDTHGPMDPDTKMNGRILDFLDSLDALVDYAEENDADAVLFAGDAFHRHSPDPTLLREFGTRIVRLSNQCPVVLLVGNHDKPGSDEKASAIDVFSTLRVPNVIVGNGFEVCKVITKNGLLQVVTIPYFTRAHKDAMSKIIEQLASEVDPEAPAILLGHFSVNAAIFGSERAMVVGESAEVDIQDLLWDAWQYVALGHLHYHQDLSDIVEGAVPIVYAGSLDRVDFSEEKDRKGFVWLEIDCDGATWEFVEVDARPFVTIDVNAVGIKDPTNAVISKIQKRDIRDAIVRVHVMVSGGRQSTVGRERISKVLADAGVFWLHSINIEAHEETRERLLDGIGMAAMTQQEQLAVYFDSVDIKGKEKIQLQKLALEIMGEVNDQSV